MKFIDSKHVSRDHALNVLTEKTKVTKSRLYTSHCSCGWKSVKRSEYFWAVEEWETHIRWHVHRGTW